MGGKKPTLLSESNVRECTYSRLKIQRCRSLFNLSSYLPRTIKGCNILRQNNKTMHHTWMTARCLFMREITLMYIISVNVAVNFEFTILLSAVLGLKSVYRVYKICNIIHYSGSD